MNLRLAAYQATALPLSYTPMFGAGEELRYPTHGLETQRSAFELRPQIKLKHHIVAINHEYVG